MKSAVRWACAIATVGLLAPAPAGADGGTSLWLEAGVRAELHKRVDLDVSQHLRFDNDVSRVAAVMPEVGLSWDAFRFLELGAGYRYEYERDDGELTGGHRVNADLELEGELRPVSVGYRVRLQDQVAESGKRRLRNRAQAELRLAKAWKSNVAGELFHDISDAQTVWQKTRFTAGLEVEVWERDVQTFYRIEVPRDHMDPIEHIIGLELRTKL